MVSHNDTPHNQDDDLSDLDMHGSANDAQSAEDSAENLEEIIEDTYAIEADAVIKNHVVIAMAVGLAPLPVFDVVTQVGNQVKMVHSLSEVYGVNFKDKAVRATILSLIGGAAPTAAVMALSSGAKLIPGIGSLVGGAGVSLGGGAATYAVGRVFANHFAGGGDLFNLDMSKAREAFRRNLRKGQDVAANVADSVEEAAQPA